MTPTHTQAHTQTPTQTHTDSAVAVHGLVRTYGSGASTVRALDDLTLAVPRGGFTAVMDGRRHRREARRHRPGSGGRGAARGP